MKHTTCTIQKLIANNEYMFRVAAVNKYGKGTPLESPCLVAKSQTSQPCAPGVPEIVATTKDSITITWNRPEYDGGSSITNYIIERRDKSSYRWINCNKDKEVTDLRYKVIGLRENTKVEFRIAAQNLNGQGPFSGTSELGTVQDPIFPPGKT